MTIFKAKIHRKAGFSEVLEKYIDQILSRSIDFKIGRSNLCRDGISETLANSINTILFSFVR